MSIVVVTNGPVAIAGSTSNFLSSKGTIVPMEVAMIIEEQILKPTTSPNVAGASLKKKNAKVPSRKP